MEIIGLCYFFDTNLMVPFISMSDLILSRARPKGVIASNPEIYSDLHENLGIMLFFDESNDGIHIDARAYIFMS